MILPLLGLATFIPSVLGGYMMTQSNTGAVYTYTYSYSGSDFPPPMMLTLPAGVGEVDFTLIGANGGGITNGTVTDVDEVGFGCVITDKIFNLGGQSIYITVGGRGTAAPDSNGAGLTPSPGGNGGGGDGGVETVGTTGKSGGSGGGASNVATSTLLNTAFLVAGGGGGTIQDYLSNTYNGGDCGSPGKYVPDVETNPPFPAYANQGAPPTAGTSSSGGIGGNGSQGQGGAGGGDMGGTASRSGGGGGGG
ncbi:hypothetical protein RQP46_010666 [Phenoliferia psychrophenolica]